MIAGSLVMLMPFLWMLSTALRTRAATMVFPPQFIPREPTFDNFRQVTEMFPMFRFLWNSLLVAALATFGQIAFSSLAGYAFGRMKFKGRNQLFLLYLAMMMVPSQVTMIPQFILMRELSWLDSHTALIAPAMFGILGTFLMRQAFLKIPNELEEAAFMDGANHFQVFIKVCLPLVKTSMATVGIFAFMGSWNDFLWPLIVINTRELATLPLGLSLLQGRWGTDWNLMMAGSLISVIPIVIVYLFAQKYFIQGMAMSGMKE